MKSLKLFAFIFLGSVLLSCSKGDETPPVIIVGRPANNSTVAKGSAFLIAATVSDETALGKITLKGNIQTETITSFDTEKTHALNYNVAIGTDAISGSVISVVIEAQDKEGNISTAERTVTVQ